MNDQFKAALAPLQHLPVVELLEQINSGSFSPGSFSPLARFPRLPVELAPARRGAPGYWPWLDADDDGVACEVWRNPVQIPRD